MSDQNTGQKSDGQDQKSSTYKKPIPKRGPSQTPREIRESPIKKKGGADQQKPKAKKTSGGRSKQAPSDGNADQSATSSDSNKPRKQAGSGSGSKSRRRRRRRGGNKSQQGGEAKQTPKKQNSGNKRRSGGKRKRGSSQNPVSQIVGGEAVELNERELKQRRGKSRKGRPVGRYMMVVSRRPEATHIAILEGRNLVEYYVSRPSDDVFQIHGNIYNGRVQNVLPGMEAAFVDIGTPKNAVIYRNDVQVDGRNKQNSKQRIEQMLKARQPILCQVAKNPIAHKGARLTGEVSLPGRFVVLVPNSTTYGISKRLPESERKRLRKILDRVRPEGHGLIVRTAAENVTSTEIERDVTALSEQWTQIEKMVKTTKAPSLIYREPDMAVRVIREEFNKEYRSVIIDDKALHDEVADYVSHITPALADRVEYYDAQSEGLDVLERYHIHEQLHKALDCKVWLPSGGSLIIERTEALTVIDVNTGKNVGSSNLEDTVFRNNIEAAEGIAQQLRLRDIGGIIVIDFVDMENRKNRAEVMRVFREALARDKTRTQAFDISELGLVEMTRKRIGEGLLESMSSTCPHCDGLGHEIDSSVLRKQNR